MLPLLFLVQTAINFEDSIKTYFPKQFHNPFSRALTVSFVFCFLSLSVSQFGYVKEEERG